MNRWKLWTLVLGGSAALAGMVSTTPTAQGRSLTLQEMTVTVGGAPANGTKCTNECNGNIDVACTGYACYNPGGNINPGDRCQGGTGGGGSVYNCINLGTSSTTNCNLGGTSSTCTPTRICRWDDNLVEVPGTQCGESSPPGKPRKRWGIQCVDVINNAPVSGMSSCTNI